MTDPIRRGLGLPAGIHPLPVGMLRPDLCRAKRRLIKPFLASIDLPAGLLYQELVTFFKHLQTLVVFHGYQLVIIPFISQP